MIKFKLDLNEVCMYMTILLSLDWVLHICSRMQYLESYLILHRYFIFYFFLGQTHANVGL